MQKAWWMKAWWMTIFICSCNELRVIGEEGKGLLTASVKPGGNFELPCGLKNNETVKTLVWKHKKEPDSQRETAICELNRTDPNNQCLNLKLSSMNSSKEGYYTCYANNMSMNTVKVYMQDSCTIVKSTKSAKEGKLLLKFSTPSDNLAKYFASVNVKAECDGTTKDICDIALSNPNTSNCEFVKSSPPYVISAPNGEKYLYCNIYLTLTFSSHCFTPEASNVTAKAELEARSTEKNTTVPVTNRPRPSNTVSTLKSTQQSSPNITNPPPESKGGKMKDDVYKYMLMVFVPLTLCLL